MATRSFRFKDELLTEAGKIAKERGFRSLNAFVAEAIANEVHRGGSALEETESRMAATLERIAKELRKLTNTGQVHLAFTDTLVRVFLQCIPQPPEEARSASLALAKSRYDDFLKGVSTNVGANLRKVLDQLPGEK